ncbi:MAG: N-formylglutamate amidohydrolase [Myxococcales bacterium]|nr:N-formylglutamate amidohydrolase [Myxococcales bacterium]MCB9714883.1 N-formylglutamate amidohydrolase [Myxococcales bacterium]
MTPPFDFDGTHEPPFEIVSLDREEGEGLVAEAYREQIFVYTVHDGDLIPRRFRFDERGRPTVPPEVLDRAHVRERDWGANLVAKQLALQLGLPSYGRVRIARALLDVNRFPGNTPPGNRDPLERLSINSPFTEALSHAQKMDALDLYDSISDQLERHVADKLIVIGIHTYDEHNPSATSRPHLSLVTIPAGYQREARMPYGVFDPIYPDVLGESTCSRILRDRVSLNLERTGFRVISNHPYALPEGSIEVRSQVWYFFSYVRRRFEERFPQTKDDPAFALVWRMLLNTNLREALPEALRGYLHRYRRAAPEHEGLFRDAQLAYERVRAFLEDETISRDYRRAPARPSSIAIEVRKDLLCELDDAGQPHPATAEARLRSHVIGKVIAGAIRTYLDTDRALQEDAGESMNGRVQAATG